MDEMDRELMRAFPEEEIMEGEEEFLVLAQLFRQGRTLEQLVSSTALPRDRVREVVEMATEIGLVRPSKADPPRFSINWKKFSRYMVEGAVGLDTEISIMVDAYQEDDEEAFEAFAARANGKVNDFMKGLYGNRAFVDLVKDYLRLLTDEYLGDDPRMYDMTLHAAARAFEDLLVKLGPESLKVRSKKNADLLASMRMWSRQASEVNMLGEVALAEVMDRHGLLRR